MANEEILPLDVLHKYLLSLRDERLDLTRILFPIGEDTKENERNAKDSRRRHDFVIIQCIVLPG